MNNVEKYNSRSHLSYNYIILYIYNSHIIKKKNYTKDLLENNILLMKYMKNYITTNKKYIKNIIKNLFYFCYWLAIINCDYFEQLMSTIYLLY